MRKKRYSEKPAICGHFFADPLDKRSPPVYDVGMMNPNTAKGGDTMTDAPATIAPKALAAELGVDPKRLRSYLRANHARAAEAKNTAWAITTDVADAAREHFAPKEEAKA
jgi:hypothetical protein